MDEESLRGLRVLVVDDQSHVRTWVRSVLLGFGISDVVEVSNGRDALSAVTEPGEWFDLIFCDLHMPERDGVETIRSFAALGLESAVVIMSVEDERVIESAARLVEAQGLRLVGQIPKPMSPANLRPVLQRFFEARHPRGSSDVPAPEHELKNAFQRNELRLMYQPKIEMRSQRFVGVEALVRWKHPTLGTFLPAAFMPMMESSDEHTAMLTDFCLKEAIAYAGLWGSGGRELHLAVNLSARAFDQLDLPERIEALTTDNGVLPSAVTLEITETKAASDSVRLLDIATRLRLKGYRLSVDDFGTGHSGLSQLQALPFTEIKIDRQFIDGCSTSRVKRSVVEASLALAHSLKMTSVAEGVEHRNDWDLLLSLGCDVMQGYFIARPMSEEGLEAWAAQWMLRELAVADLPPNTSF